MTFIDLSSPQTITTTTITLSGALTAGSIKDTGLSTGVVHSDSSGNFTSSTLVNADVSGSAAIAYSKLNLGTSIVDADINASAAITGSKIVSSTTGVLGVIKLAQDLGGTALLPTVLSLTGSGGSVSIASTGNILTWATATTAPGIKQADLTTNSGIGATLTIQAQNETGTTSTGGKLVLKSGTGTTSQGDIGINLGATEIVLITRANANTVQYVSATDSVSWNIQTAGRFWQTISADSYADADNINFRSKAGTSKGLWVSAGLRVGDGNTPTRTLEVGGTFFVTGNSGFNNTAPISKPTVTGSRGANAALTSLLTALANYGLVTDSSS